jgi:DNA-cytosine methyltransferase
MNIISLFDGISCGQVALKKLGFKIDNYFASEIDKFAISVTNKNHPNTKQLGSVVELDTTDLPTIDLLIGGSPCQSFTFAGKRNGMITTDKIEITELEQYLELKNSGFEFEGQSYLFWEYIRILKEVKPKWFLLENVKMEKKWSDIITKTIGVSPVLINSDIFSATRRQRLYWTNIPLDELPEKSNLVISDIIEDNVTIKYQLTKKHHEGFLRSYKWKHCELNEKSKPLLASYYKQPPHCPYIPCNVSESGFRRLIPVECERLMGLPDNYTDCVSDTQRYKSTGNGWQVDTILHIFKNIK